METLWNTYVKPILLLLAIIFLIWGLGCAMPTAPSDVDAMQWWPKAEARVIDWLSRHPHYRPNYVTPAVTVVEGTTETCLYTEGGRITINPIYTDGCMPHELGHAALEQANNKSRNSYEHDLRERP